jgi:hypothetical protein
MLGLGISLALGGAPSEWTILETSPDVWLKFNTGQTTPDIDADDDDDILWADQSGNGRDGTGGFTTSIIDAKQGSFVGGAWQSTDDNSFLRIGDATLSLTDDYTIFIVFTNHNADDTFIGGTDSKDFMRLGVGSNASSGRWRHANNQNSLTFDVDPSAGKQMFKILRNASDECIITQNSTTGILDAVSISSAAFLCARCPSGSAGIADGFLYELVVFNRAVTDAESALIEADILTRNSLTAD